MVILSHFYNRPVHAIRIFDRVLQEQGAQGRSLHSLAHVYSLGTGIKLRFEFAEPANSSRPADYRLAYRLGRLRPASAVTDAGWTLDAVVPMKAAWIPIGHFYLLKKASL